MTIQDVHDYLTMVLSPKATTDLTDRHVLNFFDSLIAQNNVHTLRLLICIGIDVKSSIKKLGTSDRMSNPVIKALLDCINGSISSTIPLKSAPSINNGLYNLIKFSIVQKKISPRYFSPCIQCFDSASYSRISSFRNYMVYVVNCNKNFDLNPDLTEDIDPNELDRYQHEFKTQNRYKTLNVYNLGREDSWVFVAEKNEIRSIGYDNTIEILDRLGLYASAIKVGSSYVCIEYDDGFAEETYQPNVLTGDWGSSGARLGYNGNEYFLSYYLKDDWGRTYSVSGGLAPIKERVHKNFVNDDSRVYKMFVHSLTDLTSSIFNAKDEGIIKEALLRFSTS